MDIRCFVIEPLDVYDIWLRRYTPSANEDKKCPLGWIHDASVTFGDFKKGEREKHSVQSHIHWGVDFQVHFTKQCACGYVFTEEDEWQISPNCQWQRKDTGEILHLFNVHDAPVGAMWRATWYEERDDRKGLTDFVGEDGQSWCVKTPGGEWCIDSVAKNCTRKGEPHKCWVRHGVAPDFTIDKDGNTCAAGAGSILFEDEKGAVKYHAMLKHGILQDC